MTIHTWQFPLGSSCWLCWCIQPAQSLVRPWFLVSFWDRHSWQIGVWLWSRGVELCWTVRQRVWGCLEVRHGGEVQGLVDGHISVGCSLGLSCSEKKMEYSMIILKFSMTTYLQSVMKNWSNNSETLYWAKIDFKALTLWHLT